jgi:hypothetical protein
MFSFLRKVTLREISVLYIFFKKYGKNATDLQGIEEEKNSSLYILYWEERAGSFESEGEGACSSYSIIEKFISMENPSNWVPMRPPYSTHAASLFINISASLHWKIRLPTENVTSLKM